MEANIKKIAGELKASLERIYRHRLKRLFIFGSRARGEGVAGSDLDIGLVLDDFSDIGKEINNTSVAVSELSLKHNIVISVHPLRERDLNGRRTPFMLNLLKAGVKV